jgi:hypothetical protein
MKSNNLFEGRSLLIATKHQKNRVIAPILEKELGVRCQVPIDFDTDTFGTFTGEVERTKDPLTTARLKCEVAMQQFNCDLAIASEGSFCPHPFNVFMSADEEFLVLIDKRNNLEFIAREISIETNYNASDINSEAELKEFVKKAKFPEHGIFLRPCKNDFTSVVNSMQMGLQHLDELTIEYRKLIKTFGKAYAETDMRAMYNPTRMKVIENAAWKLVEKINCKCPNCDSPGFCITEVISGLPCEWCGNPTNSALFSIYTCKKCDFKKEEFFPQNKKVEDPMYCNFCNP